MPEQAFLAMQASLVARGLLTSEHRLTAAGNDYVDDLLESLPKRREEQHAWGSIRLNFAKKGRANG